MRSVSATYDSIISSKATRNWNIRIDITLDDEDETELTITEADIMEGSFKIMSASSGQDTFDIGSAIIGKCTFALNNMDLRFARYDFFNATAVVWVKLVGDTDYIRVGFYTVDEPNYAGYMISLELLDYMWRFDTDLPTLALPMTCGAIVSQLCSTCGVGLDSSTFHGSTFTINQLPDVEMNCRELLQYIAMIGCNFCVMTDAGNLELRWYATQGFPISGIRFTELMSSPTIGQSGITITGVKMKVDDTEYMVGQAGYVLTLENPLANASNVNSILNLIWDVLEDFDFMTYSISTLPDIKPEVGDSCAIYYRGGWVRSHITNYTFTPSLATSSLGAVTPTRTLIKRYSKTVQAVVEVARTRAREEISSYDESVQRLNELAINAMGAYHEYEELVTGGRIFYLSNKPITKNAQGQCSFASGSYVYKTSGDGFFVSNDGGTTWTNGYNTSTGELIVTILRALQINAEQMYTGEMTVGGSRSGTTNPTIRVLDSSNNVVCTINSNGIIMGSGYIASSDYDYTSGHFSDLGMKIDVNDKYIRSPHFAFDNNGAYIDGEVNANSGHIGAADISQYAITIHGDVELYSGSGTFQFKPTDYYFTEYFPLNLHTEGSCTVELHKYTGGVHSLIGTYNVDSTDDVETQYLDYTVGTNPNDYYELVITGSSCEVSAKDVILAYMGVEGFLGTLRGIFKGHIDANGYFSGEISSDHGNIAGATYNSNGQFTKSGTTFDITAGFTMSNGTTVRAGSNGLGVGGDTSDVGGLSVDVRHDDNESHIGLHAYATGNADVERFIPSSADPTLYLADNPLWKSDITIRPDPPASGITLPDYSLWLVVEPA